MLQIKDLTITHRGDLRIILEKFSMVLNDGDKAVIIGEEGNGKSTLMKWIYDPELAEEYTECEGERIIAGEVLGYSVSSALIESVRQRSLSGWQKNCFQEKT